MALPETKRLRIWLLDIFACHELLVNPRLDKDDAVTTVKIAAVITVCLPLLVVLGVVVSFVAVYSKPSTSDTVEVVIFMSVLLMYFGVSSVTDRIYDRNKFRVRRLADGIRSNPEKGVRWARARLIRIYLANLGAFALIVVLARSLV